MDFRPILLDLTRLTRVEVIDRLSGREVVRWSDRPLNVQLSLQDDGRTLKLFLTDRNPGPSPKEVVNVAPPAGVEPATRGTSTRRSTD